MLAQTHKHIYYSLTYTHIPIDQEFDAMSKMLPSLHTERATHFSPIQRWVISPENFTCWLLILIAIFGDNATQHHHNAFLIKMLNFVCLLNVVATVKIISVIIIMIIICVTIMWGRLRADGRNWVIIFNIWSMWELHILITL